MSRRPLRALARGVASLVSFIIPQQHRGWAQAMAAEIACIEDDGAALAFAAGCLRVGCALAVGGWIGHTLADAGSWLGPRRIGLGCGAAATLLGCAAMLGLGAPSRYLTVQLLSLLIGLSVLPLLLSMLARARVSSGTLNLCAAAAIALTAVFGLPADGAARWVALGPVRLQPSLILLPVMMVLLPRERGPAASIGVALVAIALISQSDPALSSALLAALLPTAWRLPSRRHLLLLLLAAGCWILTMSRSTAGAAMPFVDGVIGAGFQASTVLGLLLCAGCLLLLLPAFVAPGQPRRMSSLSTGHLAFGMCWFAVTAVSLAGHAPTPLLGFGGSAVLGYLFSVAALAPRTEGLMHEGQAA